MKKLVKKSTLIGLKQSNVDLCVFYLELDDLLALLVTTHMHDYAVCGKPDNLSWFKGKVKERFTIKEIGQLRSLWEFGMMGRKQRRTLLREQHGRICYRDVQ